MADLETEVELLKSKVSDMEKLPVQLDDVTSVDIKLSNCINVCKYTKKNSHNKRKQSHEELIETRRTEFSNEIKELHSRITTNTKIMSIATEQHKEHTGVFKSYTTI